MEKKLDLIKLMVGGKKYITTRSTVFSKGDNFLTKMIENSEKERIKTRMIDDFFFIDRNSKAFEIVLEYLRTGKLFLDTVISLEIIKSEFDFYKIDFDFENLEKNMSEKKNDFRDLKNLNYDCLVKEIHNPFHSFGKLFLLKNWNDIFAYILFQGKNSCSSDICTIITYIQHLQNLNGNSVTNWVGKKYWKSEKVQESLPLFEKVKKKLF